jgi:membrane-associated phospholipid phosphatase
VLAVSGIGFAVVYAVGVLTIRGQMVENQALDASTFLGTPDGLLSLVSVENIAVSLVVLVVIGLVSRRPRAVVRAVAVVVAANALSQVLKYEVLSRPAYLDGSSANTLPSGHAVAYASVLLGLIIVVPIALRTVAALGASAVLGVVVVQLLAFGWHRPSDVVAGVLLVTGAAALAQLLLPDHRRSAVVHPTRPVLRVLVVVSVALVLAIVVLALVLTVDRSFVTTHILLLSSQVLCVAVVFVASVVTVLLQRSAVDVPDRSGSLAAAR